MRKFLAASLAAVSAAALASCDSPVKVGEAASGESAPVSAASGVKAGDSVSVLYTGSLADGSVFDASSKHGNQPLSFTVGAGQMIKGFDAGVLGMEVGETKRIVIAPADAYGERNPQLVPVGLELFARETEQFVPKAELTGAGSPFAGKKIAEGLVASANGVTLRVAKVTSTGAVIAAPNESPFAGKAPKAGLEARTERFGLIRVASVSSTGAVMEVPSHPLGGETLTFDVTLVSSK